MLRPTTLSARGLPGRPIVMRTERVEPGGHALRRPELAGRRADNQQIEFCELVERDLIRSQDPDALDCHQRLPDCPGNLFRVAELRIVDDQRLHGITYPFSRQPNPQDRRGWWHAFRAGRTGHETMRIDISVEQLGNRQTRLADARRPGYSRRAIAPKCPLFPREEDGQKHTRNDISFIITRLSGRRGATKNQHWHAKLRPIAQEMIF